MQPRTGKHRPVPGTATGQASSPALPIAPLDLGPSPDKAGMDPLQVVSPNLPLLGLNLPSPEAAKNFSNSPEALRRLSFNNSGKAPSPGAAAALFPGSPGTMFALFGELADVGKLGDLPSDDDLILRYCEPIKEEGQPAFGASYSLAAPVPPMYPTGVQDTSQHAQQQTGFVWIPHQPYNATQYFPTSSVNAYGMSSQYSNPAIPTSAAHNRFNNQQQPFAGFSGHSYPQYPISMETNMQMYPIPMSVSAPVHSVAAAPAERPKRRADETPSGSTARRKARLTGPPSDSSPATSSSYHSRQQNRCDDDPGANTGMTYRGVSRHRLTQRWEASLWLNGRQLYLGGFDAQIDAAKAYDLAALACKGPDAIINFSPHEYEGQLKEVAGFSKEEVVAYVRRRSAAFSRGKSKYRGVSGHNGRWEARIGSFNGRKNVSFGVFESEEGAARQYDRALILEKGRSAKTNFPLRDYEAEVDIYKIYIAAICGHLPRGSAQLLREVKGYTLPRDRVATADEKKRSAIIYAEALAQALED